MLNLQICLKKSAAQAIIAHLCKGITLENIQL